MKYKVGRELELMKKTQFTYPPSLPPLQIDHLHTHVYSNREVNIELTFNEPI